MELKDNITKQELVDYAVNKKVEEIQKVREDLVKKKDSENVKLTEIKKKISEVRESLYLPYVEKEYKAIIDLMVSKGNDYIIHLPNGRSKFKNPIIEEIIYISNNIVIEFKKNDKDQNRRFRGGMRHHPMGDLMEFAESNTSMITVDKSEITSPELEELEKQKVEIEKAKEALSDSISDCNNDINNVRAKKEAIKSQIIEQALGNTKEGKKMLVALQNIDFGNIKMLGSTETNK
jgi:hypothetical protein